jgi:hypothetical protein
VDRSIQAGWTGQSSKQEKREKVKEKKANCVGEARRLQFLALFPLHFSLFS